MDTQEPNTSGMKANAGMPNASQSLAVPIAIIVAGAFIALALYFGGAGTHLPATQQQRAGSNTQTQGKAIPGITSDDHILGSPDAKFIVVEYSDLECPFCKQFHSTMQQVIDEYGKDGTVAWVYRNFPLEQLHPNAPKMAEAAECVASLAGNGAYWKFVNSVFLKYPAGTFADLSAVPDLAVQAGAPKADFTSCWQADKFKDKIQKEYADAVASGGNGTPYSIIITKDGKSIPISGAQPYSVIKQVIETLKAGGTVPTQPQN